MTIKAQKNPDSHGRTSVRRERNFAIELVRQLVIPTFVLDADGRVIVWNEACARLTGVRSQRMIGTNEHWQAFYAQPRPCLADLVLQNSTTDLGSLYADNRQSADAEFSIHAANWCAMPKRGTELYLSIDAGPIRDEDGKIIAVIETLQDFTEQKRSEALLSLNASVFENSQVAVMITDAEGNLLSANKSFTEITGYSLEEVRGKSPRLLQSGEHGKEFYASMWAHVREVGGWSGEVIDRRKSGEIFPAILNLSGVKAPDGKLTHYVSTLSDISALKDAQKRLEEMVYFDVLTGLPNRVLLADRMRHALVDSRKSDSQVAVCFLDLDNFKEINDRFGHSAGDQLLIEVARRLERATRGADTVARLGGDEFVLLLSSLNSEAELDIALGRILLTIAEPYSVDGIEARISASIGVTKFPLDASDADTLLRHADQAMFQAKQMGRNRFHLFDTEQEYRVRNSHLQIGRIREALLNQEFRLFYQPKVNMRTGEVVGVEALLRWQHPTRGIVGPLEFLPLVENTDLIVDIEEWVLGEALRQMAEWIGQGVRLAVSVNIAARHFHHCKFVQRMGEILTQHPLVPSSLLELEILESSALDDIELVRRVISECQSLGLSFALDDFGTGYSSLTYLKRLRANVLKIDRSFVRCILDDEEDLAIIEGVVGLAQAFHMKVVSEGVETIAHGRRLIELGCELAQGYVISRPMPSAEVLSWVGQYSPQFGSENQGG